MESLKDRLTAASIEFLLFFLIAFFGLKSNFLASIGLGFVMMVIIELVHFVTDF